MSGRTPRRRTSTWCGRSAAGWIGSCPTAPGARMPISSPSSRIGRDMTVAMPSIPPACARNWDGVPCSIRTRVSGAPFAGTWRTAGGGKRSGTGASRIAGVRVVRTGSPSRCVEGCCCSVRTASSEATFCVHTGNPASLSSCCRWRAATSTWRSPERSSGSSAAWTSTPRSTAPRTRGWTRWRTTQPSP